MNCLISVFFNDTARFNILLDSIFDLYNKISSDVDYSILGKEATVFNGFVLSKSVKIMHSADSFIYLMDCI